MAKKRKPQTPKVGNRAMNQAFQEIRRSNAATPIPSGKAYNRKTKYGKKDWS
jgi:hypothetical protein